MISFAENNHPILVHPQIDTDPAITGDSRRQILIVDDNKELCILFTYTFKPYNYGIQSANDGYAAISLLQDSSYVPHLILLDINIPLVDGFGVMKFVRQQAHLDNTKIIVVTGNNGAAFSPHVHLADLWLIKPIKPKELVALVKRFVG